MAYNQNIVFNLKLGINQGHQVHIRSHFKTQFYYDHLRDFELEFDIQLTFDPNKQFLKKNSQI
jgi:hypothetical protein